MAVVLLSVLTGCSSSGGAASGEPDASRSGGADGSPGENADASPVGSADGSLDASPGLDANPGFDAGDGLVHCSASLASVCDVDSGPFSCPPSQASALPGSAWCAADPYAGALLGACGGYNALIYGHGTDAVGIFLYSAQTGTLSAVVGVGNATSVVCGGGDPDVAIPLSCFSGFDIDEGSAIAFNGAGAAAGCAVSDAGVDASHDSP